MKLLNGTRISHILIIISLLLGTCLSPTTLVVAQEINPAPSPFEITFEQLGYEEQLLRDPYSAVRYYFALPMNWQPVSPTYIELNLNYTYAGSDTLPPGLLVVSLNYEVLMSTQDLPSGEFTHHIDLPIELLYSPDTGLANMLELQFISYLDCTQYVDAEVTLAVRNSSRLHVEYEAIPPNLNLGTFPQPLYFYQSLIPDKASFVLPDKPKATDLEVALMIASRIGDSTRNRLPLSVTGATDLTPEYAADTHLLVVGTPDTNSMIDQLDLPVPIHERFLELHSQMPAVVIADQAFSLRITAKNTSESSQELVILDRLPIGTQIECTGCEEQEPGLYRWQLGTLEPAQEVTVEVQATIDGRNPLPGNLFEHTATLASAAGDIINVDSLSTNIDTEGSAGTSDQVVESATEKGVYFFAQNTEAVAEDAGIIQEIVSPWNPGKVVVVITGLSDEAVYKASQALGSKNQFLGMNGPVAIVESTIPSEDVTQKNAEIVTFSSLGYQNVKATYFEDLLQVSFDIPPGWLIDNGAALVLHYAFSEAMSNFFSNLEVGLNRLPIKTITLSDQEISENIWTTIELPRNLLRIGTNRLTFKLIGDYPICLSYRVAQSFWSTVFSDSYLYLPHTFGPIEFTLDQYPFPFTLKYDLSDLLFALPAEITTEQFQEILLIASSLGYSSGGEQFFPRMIQSEVSLDNYADFNVIAYGLPTENVVISELNNLLPQPFIPGTNIIQQSVDNIIYQIPHDYDLGFIQLLPSPWNSEKAILVLTGSTDTGVSWSVNTLLDDQLNYKLQGNLAIVATDYVIRTTDTREVTENFLAGLIPSEISATSLPPDEIPTPTATSEPETVIMSTPTSIPTVEEAAPGRQAPSTGPSLLWYLLGLSLVIILVTLFFVVRKR